MSVLVPNRLFGYVQQKALWAEFFAIVPTRPNKIFCLRARYQDEDGAGQEILMRLLARINVTADSNARADCSLPSDRVFGILGLANNADELRIKATYTKLTETIYKETAKALIEAGHVDVLAYCQFHVPRREKLPSGTPDWSCETRRPFGEYPHNTAFNASRSQPYQRLPLLSCQPFNVIRLRGTRIDTIETIGTRWRPPTIGTPDLNLVRLFLGEVQKFCSLADGKNEAIYRNPTDYQNAHFRIPIVNQEMTDRGVRRRAYLTTAMHGYHSLLQDTREKPNPGNPRAGESELFEYDGIFVFSASVRF